MNKAGKVSLMTLIMIVIANMVGTGVFTSVGFQVVDIQSGFAILAIWIIAGIAALFGAFSYAEISAAMPRSGGEYHFLSRIYHPFAGFVSGWVSITVGFAAPVAMASMAMGEYFTSVVIQNGMLSPSLKYLYSTTVALGGAGLISLVHLQNLKFISYFQQFFTSFKVVLIVAFILLGLIMAKPSGISFAPTQRAFESIFSMPFAISLVFAMYAFSGWNSATYIAGEVENPSRNIPRSLFIGTLIIVVLYVLLNFIFLYSTPIGMLMGQEEVGYISAVQIFGSFGGTLMGFLIAFGLISTISSMTWAGPRVSMVIGEDMKLFRFLARKNGNGVPHVAVITQLVIVVALILSATFEDIVTYTGLILTLSSFFTVLGVFVLRITKPKMNRPYKTWGYPYTTMGFLIIAGWMMYFISISQPTQGYAVLITLITGGLIYMLNVWYRGSKKNRLRQQRQQRDQQLRDEGKLPE